MADKFEEVERPTGASVRESARSPDSLVGQIRATAQTGKALRIPRSKWATSHYSGLHRQGYKLSMRADGEFVICWCEKIEKGADGEHS